MSSSSDKRSLSSDKRSLSSSSGRYELRKSYLNNFEKQKLLFFVILGGRGVFWYLLYNSINFYMSTFLVVGVRNCLVENILRTVNPWAEDGVAVLLMSRTHSQP